MPTTNYRPRRQTTAERLKRRVLKEIPFRQDVADWVAESSYHMPSPQGYFSKYPPYAMGVTEVSARRPYVRISPWQRELEDMYGTAKHETTHMALEYLKRKNPKERKAIFKSLNKYLWNYLSNPPEGYVPTSTSYPLEDLLNFMGRYPREVEGRYLTPRRKEEFIAEAFGKYYPQRFGGLMDVILRRDSDNQVEEQ